MPIGDTNTYPAQTLGAPTYEWAPAPNNCGAIWPPQFTARDNTRDMLDTLKVLGAIIERDEGAPHRENRTAARDLELALVKKLAAYFGAEPPAN